MLSGAQADNLTQAMYLATDMLLEVQKLHSEIKEGQIYLKGFKEFTPEYTEHQHQQERFEKITKDAIKDIPTVNKDYREAISILQQYPDRPGVKELLGKIYEEYPELKEAKEREKRIGNMLTGPGEDQAC